MLRLKGSKSNMTFLHRQYSLKQQRLTSEVLYKDEMKTSEITCFLYSWINIYYKL